jgi:hypothetical protein
MGSLKEMYGYCQDDYSEERVDCFSITEDNKPKLVAPYRDSHFRLYYSGLRQTDNPHSRELDLRLFA